MVGVSCCMLPWDRLDGNSAAEEWHLPFDLISITFSSNLNSCPDPKGFLQETKENRGYGVKQILSLAL